MVLNEWGKVVAEELIRSVDVRSEIELDKWIIMPNHVHIIVVIIAAQGLAPESDPNTTNNMAHSHAPLRAKPEFKRQSRSIGSFIVGFKSITTKCINIQRNTPGISLWQRNYYEHIIRDERELNKIRRYSINNPPQWEYDRENRNGKPIDEKKKFWSKFLNEFE